MNCSRFRRAPCTCRTALAADGVVLATERCPGRLAVSYNGLDGYAASLHEALVRPYPPTKQWACAIGRGLHQLATTCCRSRTSFYGTIRPKRVIRPGERPLHALRERGVEYVEVRLLDLDPFGGGIRRRPCVSSMSSCCIASAESPPDTPQEIAQIGRISTRRLHLARARHHAGARQPASGTDRRGHELLQLLFRLAAALMPRTRPATTATSCAQPSMHG